MFFWALAAAMTLATAAALLWPMVRPRGDAPESPDLQVYRDQLSEVDRDQERGVVEAAEADALRLEIKRRLLAAAGGREATARIGPAPSVTAAGVAFVATAVLAGAALYGVFGVPGLPDQPLAARLEAAQARRAERPSQAEAEALLAEAGRTPPPIDPASAALLGEVRETLATRPDDLRGHRVLMSSLAGLGQYSAAAAAQRQVLRLLADTAGAEDYLALAEMQIFAANGYVSPEAEAMLAETLSRAPDNPPARYFSGLAAWQAGRVDLTYDLWARLLVEGPEGAPWVEAIRPQMAEVAFRAGRAVPGSPSQAEMEAAALLSPEEREEMIRGMVTGLAARLEDEGGPPEDWARLIRAWGVLGETATAAEAWAAAAAEHAENPVALNLLRQAARDAEVAQ
ncbi:MAG: c-type cytochrome biogenesis protein CcmI [Pseudomonadota bacterium]